jgi:NAD(P)-dependent dehydrogenase (short-subunit alcohol dehydrogenase family)
VKKGIPDLGGRVAVITGAAGGIGRELAAGLWAKGCHLALVDLDERGLLAVARALRPTSPERRLSLHVADVADRAQMEALASEVVAAHQGVHLLINNAGVAHEAPFGRTSLDTWDRIMGINLWGTVHGCHFFMPHLAKADRAHIVNMSSLFGIIGMPGQTPYCTSKYAVRGLSEALWEELRATSIGLTVVHPGSVATDIMKVAEGDDPELMARIAAWYERHASPPKQAAAQIIRAVEWGKSRLMITAPAVIADQVKRLLPVAGNKAISDLVIRILGVEDMREKRKKLWQETMLR